MEKIKHALEKARQERAQNAAVVQPREQPFSDVPSIKYSKTRSVESSPEKMRESRLVNSMEQGEYTDALKILRTQVLQRMKENHWNTIAVTSPRRSEGKTTIAINLGISIAKEVEYTVLVVDANLRHPNIHDYFGIGPKYGLSDYLTRNIDLSEILVNPKGLDHFVILPAGRALQSSAQCPCAWPASHGAGQRCA